MDVAELLRQVKEGSVSIEAAEKELKKLPYEDLGFAKLDHHRKIRQGFEEVIYWLRQQNFSAHRCSAFLTWEWRGFTACFPTWMLLRVQAA